MNQIKSLRPLFVLTLALMGCGGTSKPTPMSADNAVAAAQERVADAAADEHANALVAQDLMSAESIIERSIQAAGGADALKAITKRISKCSMEMPAVGLKGPMVLHQKAPNLYRMLMTIPNTMKSEGGFDGTVAWEVNSMTGSRIIEGDERLETVRSMDFHGDLNWKDYFSSAKTVGKEDVKGRSAYKVLLTKNTEGEVTRYYDAETFHVIREDRVSDSPMGKMPLVSYISDFRTNDGLTFAYRTDVDMAGNTMVIACSSFDHKSPLPADMLELPEDIKTLSAATAK